MLIGRSSPKSLCILASFISMLSFTSLFFNREGNDLIGWIVITGVWAVMAYQDYKKINRQKIENEK